MTSKREKRIINEIKELEKSTSVLEDSGIYFHYDDSDINVIYAMLVGPSDTPYQKGFYFFKFTYPPSYPMQPPLAQYCTQGALKHSTSNAFFYVRFNPNLYTCGKVCLSMLNTWAGPGWVPTNTISNVLVAIQALVLNEFPLQNEPGFENADKKVLEKYNDVIEYANIKISVINIVQNTPNEFYFFREQIVKNFLKNIDFYRNFVLTKNDSLQKAILDSPAYGMKTVAEYDLLLYELNQLEDNLSIDHDLKDSIKKIDINDKGDL